MVMLTWTMEMDAETEVGTERITITRLHCQAHMHHHIAVGGRPQPGCLATQSSGPMRALCA